MSELVCPVCHGKGEIITDDWFCQLRPCPRCAMTEEPRMMLMRLFR